jgi:hypothetical protein
MAAKGTSRGIASGVWYDTGREIAKGISAGQKGEFDNRVAQPFDRLRVSLRLRVSG